MLLLSLASWSAEASNEDFSRVLLRRNQKSRLLLDSVGQSESDATNIGTEKDMKTKQSKQRNLEIIELEFDIIGFLNQNFELSIPTSSPTKVPISRPTTNAPISAPIPNPTKTPTKVTRSPIKSPTTAVPLTSSPITSKPVTADPTPPTLVSDFPSLSPTSVPFGTSIPSTLPPTNIDPFPTNLPIRVPVTTAPSAGPTETGDIGPVTPMPIIVTTDIPTVAPIARPVIPPAPLPSSVPSATPIVPPTPLPTQAPSVTPIVAPTPLPSNVPTVTPSSAPIPLVTLLELVQTRSDLDQLNQAIILADNNKNNSPPFFFDILSQPSPTLTLFAPNDSGFLLTLRTPLYQQYTITNYSFHLFNLLAFHIGTPAFTTASFPLNNIPNLAQTTTDVLQFPNGGDFYVNSTNPDKGVIVIPNIRASNGIAQIIDAVAWPDFTRYNPLQAIQNLGSDFSVFLNFISVAGLEQVYASTQNATILVVPNSGISEDTVNFLLAPGNEMNLTAVLRYLVLTVPFNYASVRVPNLYILQTTLPGEDVLSAVIKTNNSLPLPQPLRLSFSKAIVTSTFLSRNCIGYVMDQIIFPPSMTNVTPASAESIAEIPFDF